MGYTRHHAIIVTSFDKELISAAHAKAVALKCSVTEIVTSPVNGYHSFLIATDGSKEGWDESKSGDAARVLFVEWAHAQAYSDGSNSLKFAEVMYGDERGACEIVHHDAEKRR